MMIDHTKIIQALAYILTRIQKADKIKLVKLLYIADKYHLMRYGRTITNDDFWAVKAGPMGSATSDVLSVEEDVEPTNSDYSSTILKKADKYGFETLASKDEEFESLSESDIEILNIVIDKFGNMDKWALVNYSHRYQEWAQYKEMLEKNPNKRERIYSEELLSTIGDEPFDITSEHIEMSKNILTGIID